MNKSRIKAKPFLKWAGGKTQLLNEIDNFLPVELVEGKIENYYEPFAGSGAVFFYLFQKYNFNRAYLFDINPDLINVYNSIKKNVDDLIEELRQLSDEYKKYDDNGRKNYFLKRREEFNSLTDLSTNGVTKHKQIRKAALLIFLNKTCFNGLYRVNQMGKYNVPHGRYKNPKILDAENLLAVSKVLQNVEISRGDFKEIKNRVKSNSFVYYDPPYLPLNKTSSFTAYASNEFSEKEQIELADLYRFLSEKGIMQMLSNSDPKNEDPANIFFDDLYNEFRIERVDAKRFINCDATKRGSIKELIIINYNVNEKTYDLFSRETA